MQYSVTTPAAYIEALEDDWRKEKLLAIRALLKSRGPDLVEGITYQMLSYSDSEGLVCCLNAQKNYVSLYVGDIAKIDPDGGLIKGIDVGKGCLRFRKSAPISAQVSEFIARVLRMRD